MRIRNINGTSQAACRCGSWLKHWENFSGQKTPLSCPAIRCSETKLLGAHVQKADGSDQRRYIYPLCEPHNRHTGELEVSDFYRLVSANKRETCEK